MNDPAQFQCLMAGLPNTGKTTFLAALWHVAKSHEVPGSLLLEKREGDQEYLNRIADEWSKCSTLERTLIQSEMGVAILLRDPETDSIVRLRIPDMSGEIFAMQWANRSCSATFADLVKDAAGCLLFLHPNEVVETGLIADANATLHEWAGDARAEENEAEADFGVPWEPHAAPTQVKMVELLQFMAQLAGRRLRLALVVSAWDLVTEHLSPAEWVEKRLPLLSQFISSNPEAYTVSYMGVSAQGGPISDTVLLDYDIASHRIKIHAAGSKENDITHPVRWLMTPAALG